MDRLTESHFSFICPMRWEDMSPTEKGRFCEKCRKEVFDLTNCSLDEVIALQRQHGSICGSIRVVRAAAVAVSLSAAACEQGGQARHTGTPLPPPPESTCKPEAKSTQSRPMQIAGGIRPVEPKQEVMVPGTIAPLEPHRTTDEP